MSLGQRTTRHRALLALTAALCAAGAGISGCGSSSTPTKSASASHSASSQDRVTSDAKASAAAPTPSQSSPDIGGATTQKVVKNGSHTDSGASGGVSSAKDSHTVLPAHVQPATRVRRSGGTQRARDVAASSPASQPLNPCTLVSLTEAQSFTGGAVMGRVEAPLGPTCIYRAGKKSQITLAVESIDSTQVTKHMARRQEISVAGRQGYCGHIGTQQLLVPLAGGQTLAVSAPCAVARQFATAALSRLQA